MNKKAIILFSFITSVSSAAPPVTYQFTNGATIEASQVNGNYQELADRIEVLQNQVTQLQNLKPKQLVGFTTADTMTGSNFLTLTKQCQSEFTGSRICNTREIIETVNIPTLPVNVSARVAPTKFTSIDGGIVIEEVIGRFGSSISSCIYVDSDGIIEEGSGFKVTGCEPSGKKVACCN